MRAIKKLLIVIGVLAIIAFLSFASFKIAFTKAKEYKNASQNSGEETNSLANSNSTNNTNTMDEDEAEAADYEEEEQEINIEGEYMPLFYAGGDDSYYEFKDGEVTCNGNTTTEGTYEIKDRKIYVHYTMIDDGIGDPKPTDGDEEFIIIDNDNIVSVSYIEDNGQFSHWDIFVKRDGFDFEDATASENDHSYSDLVGKWSLHRVINKENGKIEKDWAGIFGSGIVNGSYMELKLDNSFLDCTSPIQSDDVSYKGEYEATRELFDPNYAEIDFKYSDGTQKNSELIYESGRSGPSMVYDFNEYILLLERK